MRRISRISLSVAAGLSVAMLIIALLARLAIDAERAESRIHDLEKRNAALSKLCGPDPARKPLEDNQ